MKKRKVISNVPSKFPITSTVLYSFLLHYFNVDNIWWGIFITLYSIYWILALYLVFTQERVDLFDEKETNKTSAKSKFLDKLEQLSKERGAK